jgi:hypothetical protein
MKTVFFLAKNVFNGPELMGFDFAETLCVVRLVHGFARG